MEDINKTSRATDERSTNERPKHWTPPSSLDAPQPKDGFVHRWLRYEIAGFQDTANMSKRLREGYELVKSEEVESGSHNYPVYDKSHRYAGFIGVGGLVLARIPTEIAKSRAEYFARVTQDQMTAVDNDLMKEQNPGMPININRQSRVTFGGGRKK